jgi:uncharacterized membrane protein
MAASLKPFVVALAGFVCLDGIWLGLVMKGFYRTALGPIGRTAPDGALTPLWGVVACVYVLLALGETVFVWPRIAGGSIGAAAGTGAMFGVVAYGVYDLTNWATLRAYSGTLALVDLAWGTVACAVVAVLLRRIGG